MTALYCEIDPFAAAWLRELIAQGHIAPGVVTETPLEDLLPHDVMQYDQVHLCAGIAVWSYALRRIGWPDHRRIWSASFPCQPFSAAGKGLGFADERHLWPFGLHLIQQCRPDIIVGEQVASKDGLAWLDVVFADLEASGYAVGAVDLCAAGVGAPHIRQRIWWVAVRLVDADQQQRDRGGDVRPGGRGEPSDLGSVGRMEHAPSDGRKQWRPEPSGRSASSGCGVGGVDHHHHTGLEGQWGRHQAEGGWIGSVRPVAETGEFGRVADADGGNASAERQQCGGEQRQQPEDGRVGGMADAGCEQREWREGTAQRREHDRENAGRIEGDNGPLGVGQACDGSRRPGPTNGLWQDADWLFCRDGKWRPVESRPQSMVDGSAESLGRVRPDQVAQIQEEINAITMETQGFGAETVRDLWVYLIEAAQRCWPSGGLPGLHEAPFLLAFVRQLQEQGWAIPKGAALPRPQDAVGLLRMLRGDQETTSAPHQRGLDRQQARKYPDVVHILSSLLAFHAYSAWSEAYRTYAEIGFLLAHNAKSRVGRLRGYGNAIVAPLAEEFLRVALLDEPVN